MRANDDIVVIVVENNGRSDLGFESKRRAEMVAFCTTRVSPDLVKERNEAKLTRVS